MFAILLSEEMDPFYQNISSFPTLLFTVLLAVSVLFWLTAILGVIKIDALELDLPNAVDGIDGVDAGEGFGNPSALAGFMLKFGLHGVPMTIIITLLSLYGWVISYFVVHFFFSAIPEGWPRYLAGIPVTAGALFFGSIATAVSIKPIKPLFKSSENATKHILGQSAVVRTSRVDQSFGEATLEDGGAGLILKIRTADENHFTVGDRVVPIEYDESSGTYQVISEARFQGLE